ncbi:MAG: S-layer family protein, partial [Iphinoe sp. HA4291-MV1]|nr:S-layer family protein [Iphinoe sp. HA4291-MV1]
MLRIKQVRHTLFFFTLPLATLASFAYFTTARAQITPDNTLGAENSRVTQDVIKGIPSDRIDGGATRGANLFHSFQEFNINAGRGAYFSNPAGIANILSRVTGGNPSNIQGILGVLGKANLFFINPNGIIFGPNARLDVGSSFFGSTANSLIFKDGFEFSATNPQAPPLLTINIPNIPIGMRFRENPGNITNQSRAVDTNGNLVGLTVPSGNSLTLVGGNVSLDNGILFAPGGRVELGGLSAAGTVGLNGDGSLSFPVGVQRGDVSLTNGAIVYVSEGGGGSIAVNARNLDISGGSFLYAGIDEGSGSVGSQAGNIDIDATESVKLSGSYIFNFVPFGGTGNSGNINVKAESVSLTDGARLEAGNEGQGNAGNITVQAKDTVSLNNNSLIRSNIGSPQKQPAKGKVGNIQIEARDVSFSNGSQLQAGLYSNAEGDPGIVSIKARDSVSFAGTGSGIFTNVESKAVGDGSDIQISTGSAGSVSLTDGAVLEAANGGRGNGGDITIETGRFSIRDGSEVSTSMYGEGKGGNLLIKADDLVEVIGTEKPGGSSGLGAGVEPGGIGKGGDLTIDTKKLVVRNAQVSAGTSGKGDGGNLTVRATDSVELSGKVFGIDNSGKIVRNPTGLFAQVEDTAEGNGGKLFIETRRLSVGDGAKVQVATFGQGNAGDLFIRASDIDVFETPLADSFPAGIYAGVQVDSDEPPAIPPKGYGGTVTIETDRLRVRDGARVSTSTEGQGDAGTLVIRAKESVEVSGKLLNPNGNFDDGSTESQISAAATATPKSTGSGGSVSIETGKLVVRDGGTVTVSNESTKPAGNLEINARSISLDNQGSITATSKSGNGGNIILGVQDFLLLRRGSQISTTAGAGGDGGNITINSPLIVAFPNENSDITANAFSGSGGKVTIRTQGLFGITPLSRQELEQRLNTTDFTLLDPRNLPTSDITAISQNNPNLSGTVQINTPDTDPSNGLFELPETVIDPAQQIAQNPCLRGDGEFVITGRGGFPTNPSQ